MSVHEVDTETHISATAEGVWSLLTDFPAYPSWNPFMRNVIGAASVGETLAVTIHPVGGRPMRFRPRLLALEAPRELRWRGTFLVPGLFDGEHRFVIEPQLGGCVRFRHSQRFSGLLVRLFRRGLEGPLSRGFIAMSHALKTRAEEHHIAPS